METQGAGADALEALVKEHGKTGQPDYHNMLGMVHRARGDVEAAIREYREALRLNPNEVMFHCNLASALAEKGEHEEALRYYHQALRLTPEDYHTHFNLGNLFRKLERMEEAIAEYQEAARLAPERAEALYNLADCYWEQDRASEAVPLYERALVGLPDVAVATLAHLRVGALYTEQRAWAKAEAHLLEVLRREPDNFGANYYLGITYLNLVPGDTPRYLFYGRAMLHLQDALKARPEDEDARQLLREALAAYQQARPPD